MANHGRRSGGRSATRILVHQPLPSILQGAYEARSVFQSLDLAWSLLRLFPRELLRRVTGKTLDKVCTPPASALLLP